MREKKDHIKNPKISIRPISRQAYRRWVRVLSGIVVFCTVYALILPAITQEAHAYCGEEEHTHSEDCYESILTCEDEDEEHVHEEDCYETVMNCTESEHEHTLICFSDPEADLETRKDWNASLPDEESLQDLSVRQKIVAIAKSQERQTESSKNYIVENETEIHGISRYGQWDGDPYEEWTGAFARFVLKQAGLSDQDIHSQNDVIDWMNALNDEKCLYTADAAGIGDVLFAFDHKDVIHAGIVIDTNNESEAITALMGDWNNKVVRKTFQADDSSLHSVFRLPIPADEEDEEEKSESDEKDKDIETDSKSSLSASENIQSEESVENSDEENEFEDLDSENRIEIPTKEDSDEKSAANDSEADSSNSVDEDEEPQDSISSEEITEKNEDSEEDLPAENEPIILKTQTEDNDQIQVEFEPGVLPEQVTLLAKSLDSSSQEYQDIYSKIIEDSPDKEISAIKALDIGFYLSDGNELHEVEPEGDVKVTILSRESFIAENGCLYHLTADGILENLTEKSTTQLEVEKNRQIPDPIRSDDSEMNSDEQLNSSSRKAKAFGQPSHQTDKQSYANRMEFVLNSFSSIAYVTFIDSGDQYYTAYSAWDLQNAVYGLNSVSQKNIFVSIIILI